MIRLYDEKLCEEKMENSIHSHTKMNTLKCIKLSTCQVNFWKLAVWRVSSFHSAPFIRCLYWFFLFNVNVCVWCGALKTFCILCTLMQRQALVICIYLCFHLCCKVLCFFRFLLLVLLLLL